MLILHFLQLVHSLFGLIVRLLRIEYDVKYT